MLKLLNLHSIIFRQYQKKYCILHIAFISSVASSSKCSKFNFILVFIFLSYFFRVYAFITKILSLSMGRCNDINARCVLYFVARIHSMQNETATKKHG